MIGSSRWFALVTLLAAGCSHAPLAPRGESRIRKVDRAKPPPADATLEEVPVCGHSVEVEIAAPKPDADAEPTLSGELLAATPAALYVVDDAGEFTVLPVERVKRVKVQVLPGHGGEMATGTLVGTLSTVTHGFLLVFSAPAWIMMGASAAADMAGESSEVASGGDPNLAAYARFPQGLPLGWPLSGPVRRCTPAPTDDVAKRRPAAPAAAEK